MPTALTAADGNELQEPQPQGEQLGDSLREKPINLAATQFILLLGFKASPGVLQIGSRSRP